MLRKLKAFAWNNEASINFLNIIINHTCLIYEPLKIIVRMQLYFYACNVFILGAPAFLHINTEITVLFSIKMKGSLKGRNSTEWLTPRSDWSFISCMMIKCLLWRWPLISAWFEFNLQKFKINTMWARITLLSSSTSTTRKSKVPYRKPDICLCISSQNENSWKLFRR